MLLKFKPDGTCAGFSIPKQFELMNKYLLNIGDELKQEIVPTIKVTKFTDTLYFLAVNDGISHKCSLCQEFKNDFVEIIDEKNLQKPKVILMCETCVNLMYYTLVKINETK